MGIQDLQAYIETTCKGACRQADLVQVARAVVTRPLARRGASRLRLVVDAESCLDRLYGGYYSDWACGGQWNRMSVFVRNLINACHSANMELVVFFNGSLETQRMKEWGKQQAQQRLDVLSVLKHLNNKATPPPKVWWQPPPCLHASLRMALRQLGVEVASSMDDHHQEVIGYCRENFMHGLLAQDSDYIIFDPPRYFSSHHLKMTYKGSLETVEYMVDEIAKDINLHPKRFCVLAALLGTHILPEEEMKDFFSRVCNVTVPSDCKDAEKKNESIRAVIGFVRALESVENLDEVGKEVFKYCHSKKLPDRLVRFKESVQYYVNGTQEGFLRYNRPKPQGSGKQSGSYPTKQQSGKSESKKSKKQQKQHQQQQQQAKAASTKPESTPAAESSTDTDTQDKEPKADTVYTEEESGYAADAQAPEIVVDPPSSVQDLEEALSAEISEKLNQDLEDKMADMTIDKIEEPEVDTSVSEFDEESQKKAPAIQKLVSSSSSSSGSSPSRLSPENAWAEAPPAKPAAAPKKPERTIPKISHDIMRIASDRHQKGLMSPWILQLLTVGEVKIPVTLEDESNRDLPPAVELYRPCRQRVYGILYDYNKQIAAWKQAKKERKDGSAPVKPKVCVKEWHVPRGRNSAISEEAEADVVNWLAPGLHRLWLGTKPEEKNRRLRAFLSCMECDVPLMLNTTYVTQDMLIMCCVLRYMLLYEKQAVLRPYELDAFLCAAVSPLLSNVDAMQEMKLPLVTIRGVELASLFMRGVEHAIFANDACGAPIPWGYCCPWLFFDGKLFHFKLLKASNNTSLIDLCDGQVDQVMQVERMKQAILENVLVPENVFARPTLPLMSNPYPPMYPHHINFRPAGASHGHGPQRMPGQMGGGMVRGMGRGMGSMGGGGQGLLGEYGRNAVDDRGGQLEIAGVVVGSWGASTHSRSARNTGRQESNMVPPHITSVGPRNRGVGGRGRATTYTPNMRGRPGMMSHYGAGSRANKVQIPANRFYNSGPSNNRQRYKQNKTGGKSGSARLGQDTRNLTLEQRTKPTGGGKGRGCTVETPEEVVAISQLMTGAKAMGDAIGDVNKDLEIGQYENVSSDSDIGGDDQGHTALKTGESGPAAIAAITQINGDCNNVE